MSRDASLQWTFAEGATEEVRRYLASGAWRDDAVEVKRNRLRAVFRCAPTDMGLAVYVKEGLASDPLTRVKSLFRCKARQEYVALQQCRAAGIPVAPVLGWASGSGGDILATEEVAGCSLREYLDSRDWREGAFLEALADFVGGLVRSGLHHPDMHVGNIMVAVKDGYPTFCLLDLYGVRLGSDIGPASRRRLVLWLVPLLDELPWVRRVGLLARVGGPGASLGSWPDLVSAWARLRAAKWPGWQRRLLDTSSLCREEHDRFGSWLLTGEIACQDGAREALLAYLARTGEPEVLKDDHKRSVARVRLAAGSYIVKEYRHVAGRWRWRADRLAWLNTARTRSLTTRIGYCHAWLRASCGAGLLVQEDVGRHCLHDYLVVFCPSPASRRPWREALASALAYLHACGCFHADLKTANWMAGEGGRLRLVDCDDVRFSRRLPERARLRNLQQIADSCPKIVTHGEKLRFLALYARLAGLSRARLRQLVASPALREPSSRA